MTTEQATELKRIMGNLEECQQELDDISSQLNEEFNNMSDDEATDNPDFEQLVEEISDLCGAIDKGITAVLERLEDISGGLE